LDSLKEVPFRQMASYKVWYSKCASAIRDALCNPTLQDNFVRDLMRACPPTQEPVTREGSETQKRLAKNAFAGLPTPAKNLLLGLTDLETKLSKCAQLQRQKQANQDFEVFQAYVDRSLSHAR
jgi:hypothetical protein